MKTENSSKHRGGFGSKIGFVLAAAGSAVGLGNIWRFPYLAAKYGGGIFLLIYVIMTVTFGFTLMLTEIAIGRHTGKSVLSAYGTVNKKFKPLGLLAMIIPALITPYYCVIGGWVLKYMTVFVSGNSQAAAGNVGEITYFEDFISHAGQPTIFFVIYVVITAAVVMLGVEKGIEKVSEFLMPVLLVLIVGLCFYIMTLDGAADGLKYYLLPNLKGFTFTKLLKTVAAVVGQLFYSLSIAMGIMITYGSYMRKEDSLESSVRQIEIFDTCIAILAGLVIVPAVFVFSGGNADSLNAGPSLMFITLPKVFDSMAGGKLVGIIFFVLVSLAALTSSISLFETVVSAIMEKFKLSRPVSCIITLVFTLTVGMLSVLGYSSWSSIKLFGMQFLDFFDFITNTVMMPILAFFTCILAGYVAGTKYIADEVKSSGHSFKSLPMYTVMIKYICPVFMIIILITPFVTTI